MECFHGRSTVRLAGLLPGESGELLGVGAAKVATLPISSDQSQTLVRRVPQTFDVCPNVRRCVARTFNVVSRTFNVVYRANVQRFPERSTLCVPRGARFVLLQIAPKRNLFIVLAASCFHCYFFFITFLIGFLLIVHRPS